jgi:hypothetical protein
MWRGVSKMFDTLIMSLLRVQINHACFDAANLEIVYEETQDGERRLMLVAKRDVRQGEFLSWDYNFKVHRCQCGSEKHRTNLSKKVLCRVVKVGDKKLMCSTL